MNGNMLEKKKVPYYIRLKDDIAMPMAGVYDSWIDIDTGEILKTFSIITTAANSLMERIHNTKKRMPVILKGENEKTVDRFANLRRICT
jgi:putative SOS response-associated peptidase YedK